MRNEKSHLPEDGNATTIIMETVAERKGFGIAPSNESRPRRRTVNCSAFEQCWPAERTINR